MSQEIITIAPSETEVTLTPGQSTDIPLTIQNTSDQAIQLSFSVMEVDKESILKNQLLLIPQDGKNCASYASLDQKDVILPAQGSVEIHTTITIPDDVLNFASCYPTTVISITGSQAGNVGIGGQIYTQIFLDVIEQGKAKSVSAKIIEFSPKHNFVTSEDQIFTVTLQNQGQYYLKPIGYATITDNSGKRLESSMTFNTTQNRILPGHELTQQISWSHEHSSILPAFGKYTAEMQIYLDPSQTRTVTATTEFYVIPIWHILGFLLILTVLISAVTAWRYRNHRKPGKEKA